MRKTLLVLLLFLTLLAAGCTRPAPASGSALMVTATNFPLYDFARAVGGDAVDVRLLLPPGTEAHVYEPTPQDIVAIRDSNVFLHGGTALEPWVERIIPSLDGSDVAIMDASDGLHASGHEHEHEESEEGHAHGADEDPHLWLDPALAREMVDAVASALQTADPAHHDAYAANAEAYKDALAALDETLRAATEDARYPMIFAGRFAFARFAEHYGLEAFAAIDSCGAEAEPSAQAVAHIIETVQQERIPFIFREAWDDGRVAEAVAAQTGAQILVVSSCNNVTKDQLAAGVTYLELMEENARAFGKGLR